MKSPLGGTEGARPAWHALGVAEVLSRLGGTPEGLSSAEAGRRLRAHGPNVIERASRNGPLRILWRQIDNPLIWVLIGSALIAVALGKLTDGLVVLAVVVLNTLVGFLQELRAGQAIEALLDLVPEMATVVRDGRTISVPVAEIVPGDVVVLAPGDKVPADLRLIVAKGLRVEEASLTGESVPTFKLPGPVGEDAPLGDRTCMAFGGTLVTSGAGSAVAVTTGGATELGRISEMLGEAVDLRTPLTAALAKVAKYITIAILLAAAALLAAGTLRSMAQGIAPLAAVRETAIFAIALAVGAIPEGLPAIVTISLAIGVQRMAARRAIVRKLPAVETLGSTTVICTDKTGTLTRNEMTVQEVWTSGGACEVTGVGYAPVGSFRRGGRELPGAPEDARRLLRDAALCSDATLLQEDGAWKITGDPTEAALVVAAEKAGVSVPRARAESPRRDALPFEPEYQLMATLHEGPDGEHRLIVKGAPEVVVHRCAGWQGGAALDRREVLAELERLAAKGMRVLAVAGKGRRLDGGELSLRDTEGALLLLGLVGMIDPPRAEAIEAVQTCQAAGIEVKMVSGDHKGTARAIGSQLGLLKATSVLTGAELAALSDQDLREATRATGVFARVAPEHKLKLVRALQGDGQVVAMTGDGVNDAPALKQANIGVAMGITGTSVAKESADIVLTDDNFASIAAAVEEGRRVYDNLVKSLAFVLPTNLSLALILTFAVLFLPFEPATRQLLLPMQPTQLLWINLVATVSLALPLAFEAKEPDVMRRPPRKPGAPILGRFVIARTVVIALLMTGAAIGLFGWEYRHPVSDEALPLARAQSMAVTTVIALQIFYMLMCRTLGGSLLRIGLFSNRTVFLGIAAIIGLQAALLYLPFLREVFKTTSLGTGDLVRSIIAGAVVVPVTRLTDWLLARWPRAR